MQSVIASNQKHKVVKKKHKDTIHHNDWQIRTCIDETKERKKLNICVTFFFVFGVNF